MVSVQAVEFSRALQIRRKDLQNLARRYPKLGVRILAALFGHLSRSLDEVEREERMAELHLAGWV
jgi:hypothetical protein